VFIIFDASLFMLGRPARQHMPAGTLRQTAQLADFPPAQPMCGPARGQAGPHGGVV